MIYDSIIQEMYSGENFNKGYELRKSKNYNWIKELFGGTESFDLTRPQIKRVQSLTLEST
jgi:hypothetical protein